jgi:hypothetical protein
LKTEKVTVFGNYTVQESWNLQSASPTHNAERIFGSALLSEIDNAETSVKTPGFKKLKRSQLPDNPYSRHVKFWHLPRVTGEQWFYHSSGRIDRNTYRGPVSMFGGNADENTITYPGDDPTNLAVQRLQSELSLSSGSLAVSLAEADKTAKHLANTATRLVGAYRSLKSGRLGDFFTHVGLTTNVKEVRVFRNRFLRKKKDGLDARQFAASSWLEYSYGWRPLISDFHAQAENLARVMINHSYVVREAKAKAWTERVYVETPNSTGTDWKSVKRVIVRNDVSFTVRYRIPDGANSVANTFGLVNPALVAWELVPFSFVADWFLPIGNFLEGLTAYNGLEFHSGTRTNKRRASITCTTTNGPGSSITANPRVITKLPVTVASNMCAYKTRVKLATFPSQKFPDFKDPRSFAHAASAIALLQSVFVGSHKGTTYVR